MADDQRIGETEGALTTRAVRVTIRAASRLLLAAALLLPLLPAPARGQASEPSGNPMHDRLVTFPAADQAAWLGIAVGRECHGVTAYHNGIVHDGADTGTAYWSVRCANGDSYLVIIYPDLAGTRRHLHCALAKHAGVPCFKLLREQR